MHIEELQIPAPHSLMEDYLFQFEKVSPFYTYSPYRKESWIERVEWLEGHPLNHRDELVQGLMEYNQQVNNHKSAFANITRLLDQRSCVVIGGQQSGILTGPLYSIHKAITILQLAEKKEKELGVPVIPVYWIAGEDHDYDEVNHVYIQSKDGKVKKIKLEEQPSGRMSISHFLLAENTLDDFIEEFFAGQIETEYTMDLKQTLHGMAAQSQTLTDFFARLMSWLFGEKGLVLVDATLPFIRQLEKETFREVIMGNEQLNEAFMKQSREIVEAGYHRQVETEEHNAHFFLYEDGKRTAVLRKEEGVFSLNGGEKTFTREDLLVLLENEPERFSANVVTRPLMQERLFPTLAFVGGPGEIAYWGLYRQYFSLFGMELPILMPRMTFSIVEGTVQKYMEKYQISLTDLFGQLGEKRDEILRSLQTFHFEEVFDQFRGRLRQQYQEIIQEAGHMETGLIKIGEKNLDKILEQVNYFEKKTGEAFLKKNEVLLRQFERIQLSLFPMDKPQERVYNIFGYLNKYGLSWFKEFVGDSYHIDSQHIVCFAK